MKRLYWEILLGAVFVLGGTFLVYNMLKNVHDFWTTQNLWSAILLVCWAIVAGGYWNQGSIVHKAHSASHVSMVLPATVFVTQCVLFVKGIYYHDIALTVGALMVNSAVVFDLLQIYRYRR